MADLVTWVVAFVEEGATVAVVRLFETGCTAGTVAGLFEAVRTADGWPALETAAGGVVVAAFGLVDCTTPLWLA